MCIDNDLFGDVVVTYEDVELWLCTVPRLNNSSRTNHVHDYIKNYDVVNKIKVSKINGSFYILNEELLIDKLSLLNNTATAFKSKFVRGCSHIPYSLHVKRERLTVTS